MKELSINDIEQVSGAGYVADSISTALMSGTAGAVAGRIAGYAFGMAWAGPVGFTIGALAGIGFSLALSSGGGSGRYPVRIPTQTKDN